MEKTYFKVKLYAIILVAGFLMNACKEPDDLGLNVQPLGDLLNVEFSDTTTIVAYSFKEDSLLTNNSTFNLLGSISDPIFGKVNASFVTEFEPQRINIGFGTNPTVDSMVLVLAYNSYYGDTNTYQTIEAYEITETLPDDSIYSNQNFTYNSELLASQTYKPRPNTKVKVDTFATYQIPQLRLKLNNSLAVKFMADTTVYSSVAKFKEFFKGLYLTTTTVTSDGAVCYFDLKKTQNAEFISKLIIYYKNDTTRHSQSFIVGGSSIKYNKFDHFDYEDAAQIIKDQINGNTKLGDSLLFLHSMAGISVKLKFPYLQNWVNNNKILINRAELVVSAEDVGTYIDDYYASTKLALAGNDTASHYYFLLDDDSYFGGTFFGGTYNTETKEYHFNITRQIQSFLTHNTERNGLYLTISGKTTNATRVVIKGSKRSAGKLRLNLTYTKL